MEFSSIHLIKIARMLLPELSLLDAKFLLDFWMNVASGEIDDKNKSMHWLYEEFLRFVLLIRDGAIKYDIKEHLVLWNLENPEVTGDDIRNIARRDGLSRSIKYNIKKGE